MWNLDIYIQRVLLNFIIWKSSLCVSYLCLYKYAIWFMYGWVWQRQGWWRHKNWRKVFFSALGFLDFFHTYFQWILMVRRKKNLFFFRQFAAVWPFFQSIFNILLISICIFVQTELWKTFVINCVLFSFLHCIYYFSGEITTSHILLCTFFRFFSFVAAERIAPIHIDIQFTYINTIINQQMYNNTLSNIIILFILLYFTFYLYI